jgi:hypothetical protein
MTARFEVSGVLQMVSELTLTVSQARMSQLRRIRWRTGPLGETWYGTMPVLDIQTWPRGDVPGLGLTDEDIGLLRGVDCDILTQGLI